MNAEFARTAGSASTPSNGEDGDRLPRRFGRYQLFDRIGKGGMATIYLARMVGELGAERLVVVKQIHDALSRDPAFSTQFVDEAKLCAGLRHANIAQVVDLGRGPSVGGEAGVLFMAMEYVEGFDLQQLLRNLAKSKIPLPPEFVFHIVRETLAALDFAHRATGPSGATLGIVHRDVSPSNVLLSFEGEVKLCDFGIARAYGRAGEMGVGEDEASGESSQESSAELGGRVVGKSAYMSPEHARGEALDARADVFAAGILLWEMCAGRRLYKGTEAEMLELAKRAEIPRLPQRGLAGHDTLQDLLDRALAPERVARFPSAKAMLEALDDYLAENRIVPSQLRFAAFLTDHFGEQVIAERRARELAAKEYVSQPPARPTEPSEAHARHPEIDQGFHEAMTVMRAPPRPVTASATATTPTASTPATTPTASTPATTPTASTPATTPTASTPATTPERSEAAPVVPAPTAPSSGRSDVQEVSTAHLGVAAIVLMIVAALLGAFLFYLVAR